MVSNPTTYGGGGNSNSVSFAVGNPAPVISSLNPTSATAGAAAETLTIIGTGFVSTSTATYNGGSARTPITQSATQLTIALSTSDLATAGNYPVVVSNPTTYGGGGNSNSVGFAVGNPAPVISSLNPTSATAGAAAETLTITGTGFVSTSRVTYYGGTARTPTSQTATQLTIALSTTDLGTAGSYAVAVNNPTTYGGGGNSNSMNFTVNNPAPAITSLSPTSATAGAAAETLTITGTGFVSTSTVTYNGGSARTPLTQSATQLTIALSTGDLGTAGATPWW